MKLHIHPYQLLFKYPFSIAHGIRTYTDSVFIAIEKDGLMGYGEATLPPYLADNSATTIDFFKNISIEAIYLRFNSKMDIFENKDTSNMPAKAAIDMALWDLKGKEEGRKVDTYFNKDLRKKPIYSTYTIGISTEDELQKKMADATDFKYIKLKLNGKNDKEHILNFRKISDKPFAIDANQAWTNLDEAKQMHDFLVAQNCFLIEQPFEKSDNQKTKALKTFSQLPIIADEAFQTIDSLEQMAENYDGINIKLMKCGGISNAHKIIESAQQLDLKILIGCMSESACGCAAAASLQSFADWTDLDGPWLLKNNPFDGYTIQNGEITTLMNEGLGIGTSLF